MSWGANATKSGRAPVPVNLTTSAQTVWTAPAYNSNVTTPSATSQIIEIVVGSTASTTFTINRVSGGTTYPMYSGISINANDTKVLSPLETFLSAGDTITALAGATGVTVTVSGFDFQ